VEREVHLERDGDHEGDEKGSPLYLPYISHISPLYLTSSEMGIMREMRRTKRIGKTITYLARGDIAEMQG